MSDAKGGTSMTTWLVLGVIVVVAILLLRGKGVTTLGDNSATADALQAKRLESGGSAFAALAGAFGAQAAAQSQERSNIAVANAQRDAALGQANAQAVAARAQSSAQSSSSFWGNAAAIVGALALL